LEKPIEELRGLKIRRNMIGSPTEAKELMAKGSGHLSAEQSLHSATGYTDGRRIDFGKLTTQTFGMKGCNPPFDFLAEDSGRQ
jgi:outer membrane receptor for Fe3+-dicitrate